MEFCLKENSWKALFERLGIKGKGIEIKNSVLKSDATNLRLFKAFYLRNYKPALNSREDCSEFVDLLF